MRSATRAWRLAPAAALAWITAAVAVSAPAVSGWIVLGAVAASVAVVLIRRSRTAVLLVAALLAVGAVAGSVALAQAGRDAAAAQLLRAGAVEVEAVVSGKPSPSAWGTSVDARVVRVVAGPAAVSLDAPIVVRAEHLPDEAVPGAMLRVRGTAQTPDAGRREVAVLRVSAAETVASPGALFDVAASIRTSLHRAVDGLPQPGAALVPGLAVGDTVQVPVELDDAMTAASLSHLTAVSGANCAIVVGAAFLAAAWCGAGRRARVAAGLASLAAFVVLVTPEPSVVRASVMASVGMLALLLGRSAAGGALLCLAVIVCLVGDPWLATSLGFALSAAATAALLVLARPLSHGLRRLLPRPLAVAVAVPLSAELVCAPILVLVEPSVSLWGVPANLLAGVAAPASTILGLLACLAAPLPVLQSGLAAVAWVPSAWIAGVATAVTQLPAPRLPWVEGPLGVVLLGLIAAAIGTAIVCRRSRITWIARGAVAVLVGLGAGAVLLTSVAAPLTMPRGHVTACDVGQGDAVVLRSDAAVMLVDTGIDPAPLRSCLTALGVERVDVLVLTHFDVDHVGGVDAVVGKVGAVLHGPVATAADQRVLDDLAAEGAALSHVSAGVHGSLGEAEWRVLWPDAGIGVAGNEASVVLDVRGGDMPSTLLLGDLGRDAQAAIRRSGDFRPPYAVVKVAHHGSADQDATLYDVARPRIALVSVGADNTYGHPRREILEILDAAGATTGRTDTDGTVVVSDVEGGLGVWRQRSAPGVGAPG